MGWGAAALITLKQAEAFYWVSKLGGVVDAAERLHLAQSTVSKRILELEAVLGTACSTVVAGQSV